MEPVSGVKEDRKVLLLSIDRFKKSLAQGTGGSSIKANLQKIQGKKMSRHARRHLISRKIFWRNLASSHRRKST
jgi:hypothetical protein